MKTFKDFLNEDKSATLEKWEDILHHIAEEELVACKVFFIKLGEGRVINFVADCNDNVREAGFQKDLSDKLTLRLTLHTFPGLGEITARVYHKNIDPR